MLPVACVLAVGACGTIVSSVQPRVGAPGTAVAGSTGLTTGSSTGPGRIGAGADSGLLGRPRDRADRGAIAGATLEQRRQCRTAGVPRGYIAIAYERSTSECPSVAARGDSTASVAVIVHYATAAVGTRLDICADQPIPSGWNQVGDEGPGDPGACPGAAANGNDTALRIRRDN